ncbi:MAG TPA: hypothetical protein VNB06_01600 [Thermoanaerobaculia bacterium]|nr:hypothetical protein [Thermoanaerobaculia bacterium]
MDVREDSRGLRGPLRSSPGRVLVWLAALIAVSPGVRAQSSGSTSGVGVATYRPPGLGVEPPRDRREALEEELAASLWNLGGLRLDPWLGIRDVIIQEVGSDRQHSASPGEEGEPTRRDSLDDDTGVVAGAGLRAILPLGQRVYLSGGLVPEYVWWQENEDRNREQINANLALDVFLGRLQLHAGATQDEQLERPSSERQLFVSRSRESLTAELELELAPAVYAFGGAQKNDIRSNEADVAETAFFSQDDRDEEILAYGVRYRPNTQLVIGLGIEDLTLDFLDPTRDRSATGESPFLAVTLAGNRTVLLGRFVWRDLEAEPGSIFGGYDELSGELAVHRQLGWRTGAELQASRDLFFAFDLESSHFESERLRGGITFDVIEALELRFFAGTGDDEYFAVSSDDVHRIDDVTEWGVGLSWNIGGRVTMLVGYTLEDFDSDVPGFDREVDRLHFGLSLSAFGGRLSVR